VITTSFDSILDTLAPIAARTAATRLRPEAFFVARAGVLTLAYAGFPEAILRLKKELEEALPDLPAENPGSLWPKTTLAALAGTDPLTVDEIVLLREATESASVCLARGRRSIAVNAVDLVELACRSMEKVRGRVSLPLAGGSDTGAVPAVHRNRVNAVLSQWRREGLSRYVPELVRSGFREGHYRRSHRELSLVVSLVEPMPCLDRFRSAVEERLPGRYAWFSDESLHVTVRSLGPYPDT